jgi:Domain of unknown function (DUF5658)
MDGAQLMDDVQGRALRNAGDGLLINERRLGSDRRHLTWRTFVQGGLTPRRRGVRRQGDRLDFVDWHEPHLLFLSVAILLLSVADALLTITLMTQGAQEANPVMAFMLEQHPQLFAAAKMSLTGMGLIVLVVLSRARLFRIIRVSSIIHWCLIGYVALIVYESWLLKQIV